MYTESLCWSPQLLWLVLDKFRALVGPEPYITEDQQNNFSQFFFQQGITFPVLSLINIIKSPKQFFQI